MFLSPQPSVGQLWDAVHPVSQLYPGGLGLRYPQRLPSVLFFPPCLLSHFPSGVSKDLFYLLELKSLSWDLFWAKPTLDSGILPASFLLHSKRKCMPSLSFSDGFHFYRPQSP